MNDIASDLPTFLQNIHKIETRKDAEDYVSRLAGTQAVIAQVIEQLRQSESIGIIPPMMVYPKVLPGAQNVLQGAPFDETAEDGILLADFRSKLELLELDSEEKDMLLNDAANALSGPFRSGYQSLITELTRLQTIANNDHGVWSLRDGAAFYANRIQNWTTVTRTAGGAPSTGSGRGRPYPCRDGADHDGGRVRGRSCRHSSSTSVPTRRTTTTTPMKGVEAYIRDATALIEGIYDIADEYFNVLPKAPLEVRRVEPWREAGSSTAFYNRPSPDGSRPGIYYINQQNMNAVQKHIMNSLAYHEGAPGHHFQLAIQQELAGPAQVSAVWRLQRLF